jgi:hypothetical protein
LDGIQRSIKLSAMRLIWCVGASDVSSQREKFFQKIFYNCKVLNYNIL